VVRQFFAPRQLLPWRRANRYRFYDVCSDPHRRQAIQGRKDDVIAVEKLAGEPGATIELGEVLMLGDGATVSAGTPLLSGASVSATWSSNAGDKIIIFKKKRRHNYRRKNGHRQYRPCCGSTRSTPMCLAAGGRARGRRAAQAPRRRRSSDGA